MGKKIKVNWTKVRELSNKTNKNSEDFKQVRQRMINIISSLEDCWQGNDTQKFISTTTAFLDELRNEEEYLIELANYYGTASRMYNGGIEDGVTRIRHLRREIDEDITIPVEGIL